jgi:hypothetical protein
MSRPKLSLLERTHHPERRLLLKLINAMWDKPALEWIERMVLRGALEAYVTPNGLILIETAEWERGRELFIYGMSGRDILRRSEEVIRDLKAIADYKSCKMIGGHGLPKAWARWCPKHGFNPISTHYVMEL